MTAELDTRRFRNALGRFATGVTIITTRSADGAPIGLTANSFNSVSLTPPLVLWNLNKRSHNLESFAKASHYGISVLAHDQVHLANRFASPVEDRFSAISWISRKENIPLFEGTSAWFECRNECQYEGGDHVIFIGEVVNFGYSDRKPLIYCSGSYSVPVKHDYA